MVIEPEIKKTWDGLHEVERLDILLDLLGQAASAKSEPPAIVLRRLTALPPPAQIIGGPRAQVRIHLSPHLWPRLDDLSAQVTALVASNKAAAAQKAAAARRRRRAQVIRTAVITISSLLAVILLLAAASYRARASRARTALREARDQLQQTQQDSARCSQDLAKLQKEAAELQPLAAQADAAQKALTDLTRRLKDDESQLTEINQRVQALASTDKALAEAKAETETLRKNAEARAQEIAKTNSRAQDLRAQLAEAARKAEESPAPSTPESPQKVATRPPSTVESPIPPKVETSGLPDWATALSPDQRKAADAAALPPVFENSLGMRFVLIPPGEFMMGSPDTEKDRDSDEGPVHRVRLTQPFYLAIHEVTQRQYEAVMGTNPSGFKGPENPVEQVSWNDAQDFCKKLSQKEGKTYRLATEAEWEYACRAGAQTRFSYGDDPKYDRLGEYAWYTSNSDDKTHPVGEKKPNAWALFDMHGNVSEWCEDWHEEKYYGSSPQSDPKGPNSGWSRVKRGGSWYSNPRLCRSAFRSGYEPGDRYLDLGFRVVCAPRPSNP